MNKQRVSYLLCAVFVGASPAPAQDSVQTDQGLSLFEAIEVDENRARANSRTPREARATISEPEFTLIGTSRIGDRYSAIIRHRGGESILVRSQGNATTPITGHAGYSVVSVGSGRLSLRYPAGVACVEDIEQGVSCAASSNTAELILSASDPLSRPVAAESLEDVAESAEAVEPNANPFEALRAARADGDNPAQNGAIRNDRFVPRRIEPADVPPGMRVVSTPFGDRLVEQ